MDRRTFLLTSLASGVMIWAGSQVPGKFGSLFQVDPANAIATANFPQSVASGDPQVAGITLWTRLAPQTGTVQVAYQVSTDPNFGVVTLAGVANAEAVRDYTLKVQLSDRAELRPATTYFYRFIFNNNSSAVGRFKTLPAENADVSKIRFAYISCNDFTNGFFNAMRFMAAEDLDFVVHLGDAIYETVSDPTFQRDIRPLSLPSGQLSAQSLEDYRFLHKTYISDPDYIALREQFAFIYIWDDHEFANDAYQQFNTDTAIASQNNTPNRRQVASQAWAEYTPTSITFTPTANPTTSIQIYRSFVFGNLMELVMTDERLYRDAPACGVANRNLFPGCAQLADANRSMLGATQKQFFLDKIRNSTRTWKIWGNEVATMQLIISKAVIDAAAIPNLTIPVDLFLSLDQWDGYPVERAQIFTALRTAGVKNFVTITGDFHTFEAGYQRINYNTPFTPGTVPSDAVGVEFLVGSISASNLSEQPNPFGVDINTSTQLLLAGNRHVQYLNSATHGYNIIEVTPTALTCTMRAVSTILTSGGTVSTLKTFSVPRDQVLIQDITGR